jgi:hypothetical protein
MIYLSGQPRFSLRHPMVGFMASERAGNVVPSWATWAADNGRFASPRDYSDDRYLNWLDAQDRQLCLFATAPDVLADHDATIAMSFPLLPRLRALGYKAAFVAQDNWCEETTPWDELDVLFIGGTTEFKLSHGGEAVYAGKKRKKWVHMGRVNSFKRLRVAAAIGCNSVDGTFLKFAPNHNEGRMLRWLERLDEQPLLKRE